MYLSSPVPPQFPTLRRKSAVVQDSAAGSHARSQLTTPLFCAGHMLNALSISIGGNESSVADLS